MPGRFTRLRQASERDRNRRGDFFDRETVMSRFVPQGSYLQSASNVNVHLYAKSQRRDQSWIASGADITGLTGGLVNWDGFLQPENDPLPAEGFVPNGSYRKTTENVSVVLAAYCRRIDGSWQWSTLDITNYMPTNGDIANIDGSLMIQRK
jgi:hypothetical protein